MRGLTPFSLSPFSLSGLGRFLQTDPLGLQTEGEKLSAGQKALFSPGGSAREAFSSSEMNLFRYCGNDPINRSDPLGLYGMGTGWNEKDWKRFDIAQQAAAARLEKASEKMDPKVFEKVFGKGSATPENLAKVQHTMQAMAAALRDDGTKGFVANAFSDPKSSTLGVGNVSGNRIRINVGHRLFGGPVTLTQTVGHESVHNAGLNHVIGTDAPYRFGTEHQRGIYKNLPTTDRLRNPDNYMEFAE